MLDGAVLPPAERSRKEPAEPGGARGDDIPLKISGVSSEGRKLGDSTNASWTAKVFCEHRAKGPHLVAVVLADGALITQDNAEVRLPYATDTVVATCRVCLPSAGVWGADA